MSSRTASAGAKIAALCHRFQRRTQQGRTLAVGDWRDHLGTGVGRLAGELGISGNKTDANHTARGARLFQSMQGRRSVPEKVR